MDFSCWVLPLSMAPLPAPFCHKTSAELRRFEVCMVARTIFSAIRRKLPITRSAAKLRILRNKRPHGLRKVAEGAKLEAPIEPLFQNILVHLPLPGTT